MFLPPLPPFVSGRPIFGVGGGGGGGWLGFGTEGIVIREYR
jgi:hypothetical protein